MGEKKFLLLTVQQWPPTSLPAPCEGGGWAAVIKVTVNALVTPFLLPSRASKEVGL